MMVYGLNDLFIIFFSCAIACLVDCKTSSSCFLSASVVNLSDAFNVCILRYSAGAVKALLLLTSR